MVRDMTFWYDGCVFAFSVMGDLEISLLPVQSADQNVLNESIVTMTPSVVTLNRYDFTARKLQQMERDQKRRVITTQSLLLDERAMRAMAQILGLIPWDDAPIELNDKQRKGDANETTTGKNGKRIKKHNNK